MPPLAPHGERSWSGGGGGGGRQRQDPPPAGARQRSASFHGRGAEQRQHQQQPPPLPLQKQRPKTMPDLLAGARGGSAGSRAGSPSSAPAGGETGTGAARTPSKVLVSVSVQGSMWPLHVMAQADWRVADLVAAAVALYVREARRPALPSADPAAFGLHYSQFSLDSLDPNERVMELGSRSFFLCPKASAFGQAASSSSSGGNRATREASGKAGGTPAWLSYVQFWPIM